MDLAKENRECFLAIAEQFTATKTHVVAIIGMGEDGIPSVVFGDKITPQLFLSITTDVMKQLLDQMENPSQDRNDIIAPSDN